jgi:hypothetical protein
MKKNNKTQILTNKQYEDLGRSLEQLYMIGYTKPKRMLYMTFIKGIVYGFGIFIGGTIVVGLVFWVLGQFNQIPVLSPFIEKIVDIVNTTNSFQKL